MTEFLGNVKGISVACDGKSRQSEVISGKREGIYGKREVTFGGM